MISLMLAIICALLAMIFAALYSALTHIAPRELKRRARRGDDVAVLLYRSASFGLPTKVVVIGLGLLSLYGALTLFMYALGGWYTLLILVLLGIIGALIINGKGRANAASLWLAARLSPGLAWFVERLHPVVGHLARFLRRLFPMRVHSGLYEKEDLVQLLEQQKYQPDNRISHGEIDLLTHALTFGDKMVIDALVPKRVVKSVSAADLVGPVLMDELHASGHSRFPVYDGKKDNLVGVLYLHDLVATKKTKPVEGIMRRKLVYVSEDFTLYQTLQAFIKTKQHLFIVVNRFEEYVGIITIEDVLEQIIGKLIVDEFDQYDDLRAAAAAAAKKDHEKHAAQHAEPAATEPATEVVK